MIQYQRRASQLHTGPSTPHSSHPSWRLRGRKATPRARRQEAAAISASKTGILHQTVSKLPVANQIFLGFWTVDIYWEGHSQRSAAQKRQTAHLKRARPLPPRKPSGWDRGGDKTRLCSPSIWSLGRAQNAGPTESVASWSTRDPETERLRPGKCTQPRACLRQFPSRAT